MTSNEFIELITKNIIRKRREGKKWMKPESIYPEYADDYNFEDYDLFNIICYEMEKKGIVKIDTRREYKHEYQREEAIASDSPPMIKKIRFVEGSEELVAKAYLKAKNENMKNKKEK